MRIATFAALLGVFLGLVGAFGVGDVPVLRRTLYFSGAMVCGWLLGYVVEVQAKRLPGLANRRWARLGLAAFVAAPVMGVLVWASMHWLTPGGETADMLLTYVAASFGVGTAMSVLAFVVFRSTPVTHAAVAGAPRVKFMDRLPAQLLGAEIWALQAEDHYLRIHTSRGSDLILMRLSDAIRELEGIEGAQSHRSWWVARAAVQTVRRIDERAVLALRNGLEVPVSRKFVPTLREAGWF